MTTLPSYEAVANIQRVVAEHYRLPRRIMTNRSTAYSESRPRQMAMFLARELTNHSLLKIGRLFGGRDRSTVYHAHKRTGERIVGNYAEATNALILRDKLTGRSSGWEG